MVPAQTEALWILPFLFVAALAHADNQRDRNSAALTANSQANATREDVDLTRMIRRELVSDDSLTAYGKNVKIITQDGVTTLRGPVKSAAERNEVAMIATRIVGKEKVLNELEIKQ